MSALFRWSRRAPRLALLVALLVACRAPAPPERATTAATASPAGASAPQDAGAPATVERVVDGDTLVVRIGRRSERLRLIGVDTPETKKPDSPIECFGPEAADRLAALLPNGTEVRLLRDVEERDDYERLLAYLFLPDGDFVNLRLVAEGYAETLRIEPNTAFAAELAAAQAAARSARLGMWGACPAGSAG